MPSPFAQGPRLLDRGEGGLGLGLALARRFTELHGGTIALEPIETGGSRFVVTLPRAADNVELRTVSEKSGTIAAVPRRVLVVDDNADAAEMLCAALGGAGHVVASALNGLDAISIAKQFDPEVAILDIGLPDVTGYELARHLRTEHPSIRLIALTGYGQVTDVNAAKDAGFDVHRAKPLETELVLELIEGTAEADNVRA